MTIEFNFVNLVSIYREAYHSYDKSLVFELEIGKGKFLFMMFLSDEDKDAKDNLFIYLRNTNRFVKLKLYGSHLKGDFKAYINDTDQQSLIEELQLLSSSTQRFDFMNFLEEVNSAIPLSLPIANKTEKLRKNRHILSQLDVVDEKEKTVLIGEMRLSSGRTPQDKTLRKLYMYTNGDVDDIKELIVLLKKVRMTVRWTKEENRYRAKEIREIINKLELEE